DLPHSVTNCEIAADKIRNCNRQRLHVSLRHIQPDHRAGLTKRKTCECADGGAGPEGDEATAVERLQSGPVESHHCDLIDFFGCTSAADLKFLHHFPQIRLATS